MEEQETTIVYDSFFVTNMLPQAAKFKGAGGAWRRTEEIAECYREISTLRIWGGVIWGHDATNDVFVDSHNVITPDRWWKVIYREDTNTYIAWIFENTQDEKREVMDNRIVTLEALKATDRVRSRFRSGRGGYSVNRNWELSGSNPLRCEGTEADPG